MSGACYHFQEKHNLCIYIALDLHCQLCGVLFIYIIQFFHVCISLNSDVIFVLTNGVPEKHMG